MPATAKSSVVEDVGEYSSHCGYCGNNFKSSSVSHGMQAHTLTVDAYQELLDRGWRRSGTWLYRPLHERTCCPPYTIRLDVHKFEMDKVHKRVLRRMERFLRGEAAEADHGPEIPGTSSQVAQGSTRGGTAESMDTEEPKASSNGEGGSRGASSSRQDVATASRLAAALDAAVATCVSQGLLPEAKYSNAKVVPPGAKLKRRRGDAVLLTSAVAFALAATARRAAGRGPAEHSPESIADRIAEVLHQKPVPGWRAEAEQGHLNFTLQQAGTEGVSGSGVAAGHGAAEVSMREAGAASAADKQKQPAHLQEPLGSSNGHQAGPSGSCGGSRLAEGMANGGAIARASLPLHAEPGSPPQHPRGSSSGRADAASEGGRSRAASGAPAAHRLRIVMERASPALIAVEFALYHKYQVRHHGDMPEEVTPKSFRRFLVDSPLVPEGPTDRPQGQCPPCGFGTFHQQYWLDDELIAVGVLDVLPNCLSSKYFFWDPDYTFLSLGKFSALKEIEWISQAAQSCPSLHYYYMGFFIPTCHKMRYKADYRPSDLLCPRRLCWLPYSCVQPAVDAASPGVCILSDVAGAQQGLGPEHGFDGSGEAMAQGITAEVAPEQLRGTHLLFSHVAAKVSLADAVQLEIFPEDVVAMLEEKLRRWHQLVGPNLGRSMLLLL